MSLLVQQLVVFVLVVACALFAAWRLSTARVRLRLLATLGTLPLLRRASWLETLRRRTLAGSGSGCGGCAQKPGAAGPKAIQPRRS